MQRWCVAAWLLAAGIPLAWAGGAASFVAPPTLTLDPAGNAPLAAEVLVATDIPSQVTLRVTDGIDLWTVKYPDFQTDHSVALFGLKPNRTYSVEVTLTPGGATDSSLLTTTGPLPEDFPAVRALKSDPANMEPGFTLLDSVGHGRNDPRTRYTLIVDAYGDVVWYSTLFANATKQLPNGNLGYRCGQSVCEGDLFGRQTQIVALADPGDELHHDLVTTSDGTYLSLTRRTIEIEDYPSSYTDPNAPTQTATVRDEPIIEFAADGSLLHDWSLTDIIDPTRIGYDSLFATPGGLDSVHTNAVIHDPRDDSVIVSARHQDALVKFSRSTGELIWILGTHANWKPEFQSALLTPVGAPFEWQYHQHAPMITPTGNLLLFDNGNYRASPFDGVTPYDGRESLENYTRAVEFAIDEETMEIRQVWEYGSDIDPILYANFIGDADWLPRTGNVLITFGGTRVTGGVLNTELGLGAVAARIIEVTHDTPGQKVFELLVSDPEEIQATVYRSERIPSLYDSSVMVSSLGPIAVGAVPDGGAVPGTPLTLDKADGTDVTLAWGASCVSSDLDFAVYEGSLGDYAGHAPVACSTAGERTRTLTPGAGNRFYLIVPTNGTEEGSYGLDGGGSDRTPAAEACLTQMVASCPGS